ncbi:ribosome silencing factor [Ruminococcus sp. Marseille-P6503]|uniref:ribosome silencing factor n=1 Tax=Ruminococcus sp. Marseille-P6503 TaxID=2364796 RepID=UPI0019D2A501|nr:ribosome silencing factor [Ruminococcus sp. Marseille-P6503]
MANISQEKLLETIIRALDSKRAEDIQLIGIRDLTIVADYFVIANGTSNTQTKALADAVEFEMKQLGIEPIRVEGYQGATWIILDYGDIVVHVFYKETRSYYNLERLWSDGEQKDIEEYLSPAD